MYPTCVGMNRQVKILGRFGRDVPHMRGDEPLGVIQRETGLDMYPTCVGMNRRVQARIAVRLYVPHMRGDEPACAASSVVV